MISVNLKKTVTVLLLLVTVFLSMTVFTEIATDPENHKETIASLDRKKSDVLKLTATSAASSTALAAIPGDATTPIANKLADLTSYFLIILMVVFLEKYLVTITGYITFFILIPVACAALAAGICLNRTYLKVLAVKTAVFGFIIFAAIPFSMHISSMVEETYQSSMEETVEEAQELTDEINKSTDSEGNIIEKALAKIKDGVSGLLESGEKLLNQFIEMIAVMMVTSCLIPIAVILFMLWIVRLLFGVKIDVPKGMPKKISGKLPGHKPVYKELREKES